jgi:ribosomal protein S3
LKIHGIDVDTQSADAITVTIKLNRPGLLIGKGGSSISSLEAEMTKYFNKKTNIQIVEVQIKGLLTSGSVLNLGNYRFRLEDVFDEEEFEGVE